MTSVCFLVFATFVSTAHGAKIMAHSAAEEASTEASCGCLESSPKIGDPPICLREEHVSCSTSSDCGCSGMVCASVPTAHYDPTGQQPYEYLEDLNSAIQDGTVTPDAAMKIGAKVDGNDWYATGLCYAGGGSGQQMYSKTASDTCTPDATHECKCIKQFQCYYDHEGAGGDTGDFTGWCMNSKVCEDNELCQMQDAEAASAENHGFNEGDAGYWKIPGDGKLCFGQTTKATEAILGCPVEFNEGKSADKDGCKCIALSKCADSSGYYTDMFGGCKADCSENCVDSSVCTDLEKLFKVLQELEAAGGIAKVVAGGVRVVISIAVKTDPSIASVVVKLSTATLKVAKIPLIRFYQEQRGIEPEPTEEELAAEVAAEKQRNWEERTGRFWSPF